MLAVSDLWMRQTGPGVAEVEHPAGVLPHVRARGVQLGVSLPGQILLNLVITVRLLHLLLHHLVAVSEYEFEDTKNC